MENSAVIIRFAINRIQLVSLLKSLKVSGAINRLRNPTCEMTLTENKLTFVTPAVSRSMEIVSTGSVKVSFALNPFIKLINTYTSELLSFQIFKAYVMIENYKFPAQVTFIENDKILRSVDLPINYTPLDLLTISRDDRYTPEELKFNGLNTLIKNTEEKLSELLNQTVKKLSEFGIERSDLEKIIYEKIAKRLNHK